MSAVTPRHYLEMLRDFFGFSDGEAAVQRIDQAIAGGLRLDSGSDGSDAALTTHKNKTTDVHGITDTSTLLHDSVILDEDTLVSNSAAHVPTQQSVKAYVDTEIAAIPQGQFDQAALVAMPGAKLRLIYMTVATSAVAADGWYTADKNTVDLTGRLCSIEWEGTEAQIPTSGTGDSDFKTGDTAFKRGTSL